MNSFLKVFSFALLIGAVAAGGPPRPRLFGRLFRGYRGPRYYHDHLDYHPHDDFHTSAVITKSSPIYYSKSVAPATTYISSGPSYTVSDVHAHEDAYINSAAPAFVAYSPGTVVKSVPAIVPAYATIRTAPSYAAYAPATVAAAPAVVQVAEGPAYAVSSGATYAAYAPAVAPVAVAPAAVAPAAVAPATVAVAPAAAPTYAYAPATVAAAPAAVQVAEAPAAAPVALVATRTKPQHYAHSIPAAAIRNVETVMVTKTITPVVTKTTTHHTSAEPAVAVGHVQGYSHGVVGQAKLAPVQFETQYTTYANPTVGINGPVVYTGVAAQPAAAVAAVPVAQRGATVAAIPVAQQSSVPVAAPAVYKTASQPVVYKTISQSQPAVYKTISQPATTVYKAAAPASAVLSSAVLSTDTYGVEAYSVPSSNFIELKSGSPVLSGGYQKKK